jgi:hypothetical protein
VGDNVHDAKRAAARKVGAPSTGRGRQRCRRSWLPARLPPSTFRSWLAGWLADRHSHPSSCLLPWLPLPALAPQADEAKGAVKGAANRTADAAKHGGSDVAHGVKVGAEGAADAAKDKAEQGFFLWKVLADCRMTVGAAGLTRRRVLCADGQSKGKPRALSWQATALPGRASLINSRLSCVLLLCTAAVCHRGRQGGLLQG